MINEALFFYSIVDREIIFIRKELQYLPKEQWTKTPVYQKYRFCNVHRCYDKTYKLLMILSHRLAARNMGGLHPGLRTVLRWLASNELIEWCIDNLRYTTELSTYIQKANCGHPEQLFAAALDAYHQHKIKLCSGSFIVKRCGRDFEQMMNYYKVGTQFYEDGIQASELMTSEDAVKFFKKMAMYCSDFTAYCIVSDWLYLRPDKFTDKYKWTAYGPGAFSGINLLIPTTRKNYIEHIKELHTLWCENAEEMLNYILKETGLTKEQLDTLCVEKGYLPMSKLLMKPLMLDVEHWLCEYAKYSRGYSRRRYVLSVRNVGTLYSGHRAVF